MSLLWCGCSSRNSVSSARDENLIIGRRALSNLRDETTPLEYGPRSPATAFPHALFSPLSPVGLRARRRPHPHLFFFFDVVFGTGRREGTGVGEGGCHHITFGPSPPALLSCRLPLARCALFNSAPRGPLAVLAAPEPGAQLAQLAQLHPPTRHRLRDSS